MEAIKLLMFYVLHLNEKNEGNWHTDSFFFILWAYFFSIDYAEHVHVWYNVRYIESKSNQLTKITHP